MLLDGRSAKKGRNDSTLSAENHREGHRLVLGRSEDDRLRPRTGRRGRRRCSEAMQRIVERKRRRDRRSEPASTSQNHCGRVLGRGVSPSVASDDEEPPRKRNRRIETTPSARSDARTPRRISARKAGDPGHGRGASWLVSWGRARGAQVVGQLGAVRALWQRARGFHMWRAASFSRRSWRPAGRAHGGAGCGEPPRLADDLGVPRVEPTGALEAENRLVFQGTTRRAYEAESATRRDRGRGRDRQLESNRQRAVTVTVTVAVTGSWSARRSVD